MAGLLWSGAQAMVLVPPVTVVPGMEAPARRSVPTGTWVPVGSGEALSLLRVPRACGSSCALVVVSHPRGQSAAHLRDSASVAVLTAALIHAGFAVLLSGDGGPTSWGSPAGLAGLGEVHARATELFGWSGRTYALGLSMGGLMALRSALPGAPYPVEGVALIDGWVDLRVAWGSALSRREEIMSAYGLSDPPEDLNPAWLARTWGRRPLLVFGSPDDRTVPFARNGEALWLEAADPDVGGLVRLTGGHLGGNRFTADVARQVVVFFRVLEGRR
ncbi:alpha/beta hydrolase family protein [Deinococcus sedimenti]|uniref:alpha/beta hydrolase family protein n=1 Tax=Deinococcus sedimenti TaxID=1867090 RepID=UPI001E4C9446|nr:alpha/beta hydrolase [Deinococcus sedimenti]